MGNLGINTSQLMFAMLCSGMTSSFTLLPVASVAQTSRPTCTAPEAGEFVVLIFTPSESLRNEVRSQVEETLDEEHGLDVCEYGGNILSRVGGFVSQDKATQWAEYLSDTTEMTLMVITPESQGSQSQSDMMPPSIPTLSETAQDGTVEDVVVATEERNQMDRMVELLNQESDTSVPSRSDAVTTIIPGAEETESDTVQPYQPQSLMGGYGVLVDYDADPSVATRLEEFLGRDIGLAVYDSRFYLFVAKTQDRQRSQKLVNRIYTKGFTVIAVPSEYIVLLTADVSPQ